VTRVAVLVSGGGTNLQAIIDAKSRGETPGAELALVVSSRKDAYALERAKAAGIPCEVLSPKSFGSPEEFDASLRALLESHGIEAVALAGYLTILGPMTLERWRGRILNVHPSLIPSFCGDGWYGLRPHTAALERGVKVTGATVHLVNEVTDGGTILAQKAVDVLPDDTPHTLQQRVMRECEWVLLPRCLEELCQKIQEGNA